ncbi:hypothetical protein OPIT5_15740 [Opitutaceae bacterium TAV5]|nr:hypothetical protein OPIT5_15740 [Opitutaceae bacterium TAV5]
MKKTTKRLTLLLLVTLFTAGAAHSVGQPATKPASTEPASTSDTMTTEQLAAPALVPPVITTSPLPEYGYDRLDYGMTIGIERTPGGRLWACWVGGGDNDKAFFVLATSDDDGETWSSPRVVIDPHDDSLPLRRRTVVGNLWTDPQGRLWLFFDQSMTMFDGRAGGWRTICENPDAARPEWSPPVRISDGCTLNKPLVLANGDWLLPVSLWGRNLISRPFSQMDAFRDLDHMRMANVFVSSDQGRTWERRGGVAFPNPRFDEHMFIERRDGSIWMTARTRTGLWESTSTDGGRTWSKPTASPVRTASARHFIRRLQSGNIVLVKHGVEIDKAPMSKGEPFRSHLTAFLSDDDGHTWKGGLLLDERRRVSYPDGFQAPDGTIYVSWDRDRNGKGEILMARFTEEDILAGKFAGPKSRTQMLISRPDPAAVAARLEADRKSKDENAGKGAHEILEKKEGAEKQSGTSAGNP